MFLVQLLNDLAQSLNDQFFENGISKTKKVIKNVIVEIRSFVNKHYNYESTDTINRLILMRRKILLRRWAKKTNTIFAEKILKIINLKLMAKEVFHKKYSFLGGLVEITSDNYHYCDEDVRNAIVDYIALPKIKNLEKELIENRVELNKIFAKICPKKEDKLQPKTFFTIEF